MLRYDKPDELYVITFFCTKPQVAKNLSLVLL